jgi:hypothetical protein
LTLAFAARIALARLLARPCVFAPAGQYSFKHTFVRALRRLTCSQVGNIAPHTFISDHAKR